MAFSNIDNPSKANKPFVYLLILVGAATMAVGFSFFIIPYNIVPGGVFGLSISLHTLSQGIIPTISKGIPVGIVGFVLMLPLLMIGRKYLGPRFGTKTIIGFLLTAIFIDTFYYTVGFNDPLGLSDDVLLSSIVGGVLIGLGLGFIFKSKATSGGSDIIAMIISKLTGWPIGQLLIYIDSTIILTGLLVFKDWKLVIYSWLTIYVIGKVVDMVVEGFNYEKLLHIVSDKSDEIIVRITSDLNRDGVIFKGVSLKENTEKKVIQIMVNRREVSMVEEMVTQIDEKATITVTDAIEVLGKSSYEILPE